MRHYQGVTIIELLVTMAILGVVSWAVLTVWMGGQRAYDTATALAEAQATARIAMTALEQELRSASRASFSIKNGALSFDTILPDQTDFATVQYFLAPTDYKDKSVQALLRQLGSTQRQVALHVDTFSVQQDKSTDSITIELVIRVADRQASLRTTVQARNP